MPAYSTHLSPSKETSLGSAPYCVELMPIDMDSLSIDMDSNIIDNEHIFVL